MKKLLLSLLILGSLSAQAETSSPGFAETAAKIKMALNSPELAAKMNGQAIETVSVVDDAVMIQRGNCGFVVDLNINVGKSSEQAYSIKEIRGPFCSNLL